MRGVCLFLVVICLVACSGNGPIADHNCAKSFCGCYKDHILPSVIKLTAGGADPVQDATLICLDNDQILGTTNDLGEIPIRVTGQVSPGCGFIADCKVAFFRTSDGGYGRPFWFHRSLRGEGIETSEFHIEIVKDAQR